jgi:hypothetical protein
MSGGFRILPNNDVLVRIKLFPRFDGAEYIVVVGKMKQFHADQYRLIKDKREAMMQYPTPSGHKEVGTALSTAASGDTCKGDLPLKTPQRGSGKSEQLQ